ncbi:MAG TPA: hypothetical protein VLM83_03785 [Anaerolineales bacterium]|nr:hypothetical protein [Anaerolineales bacterium]
MEKALQFFKIYEIWIYGILTILAIWQLRKFANAWNELRGTVFGMEREAAQARLNQAATILVLVIVMAVAEFTLVSIVIPSMPGASPLPTATLDLLATPTTTLVPTPGEGEEGGPTPTPAELPAAEGCIPGQINLTAPLNGDQVTGVITLRGTANIPNFGFYTYEIARPGESIWLPVQVGRQPIVNDVLGVWDTTALEGGDYMLRLVVTDNVGTALSPCAIQVRVLLVP